MPVLSADVDVELDVVDRNNKPPVWDANVYGPIHIKENVTVGTVVTSVKARFVCHDMTETRHVTCRAVPCSALRPLHLSDRSNDLFLIFLSLSFSLSLLGSLSSTPPCNPSFVCVYPFPNDSSVLNLTLVHQVLPVYLGPSLSRHLTCVFLGSYTYLYIYALSF